MNSIAMKAHTAKILVLIGSALDYLRPEDVMTKLAYKQLLTWAIKGCNDEKLLALSNSLDSEVRRADLALDVWNNTPSKEGNGPLYRSAIVTSVACLLSFAVGQNESDFETVMNCLGEIPVNLSKGAEEENGSLAPLNLADLADNEILSSLTK
jgi:hypothetical protein